VNALPLPEPAQIFGIAYAHADLNAGVLLSYDAGITSTQLKMPQLPPVYFVSGFGDVGQACVLPTPAFSLKISDVGAVSTSIQKGMRQTPNATAPVRDRRVEAKFEDIFRRGAETRFEDGMDTEFSNELVSAVATYGRSSKDMLSRLLDDQRISPGVWAEALRWLGRMNDAASHESRLWVLEKALTSPHAAVRDGAALGLASMNDLRATPYLQKAKNAETIDDLRSDLEQVLLQLRNRH
jgi:hypothetical protein